MDSYYASQMASSSVGTFHGPARQFGSGAGLGAFALRVGRTAVPLLKKYVGPFVKQVGQNVLEAALPEVVSLIKGKKGKQSLNKRALKDGAKKVLAKVVETHAAAGGATGGDGAAAGGDGAAAGGQLAAGRKIKAALTAKSSSSSVISNKKSAKRSRLDILANVIFNNNSSVRQNEQYL